MLRQDDHPPELNGCYHIVQFHPAYTYEDFIGGIRPALGAERHLAFEIHSGVFKRFCDTAQEFGKPFVLVIDEINRADLASVFGETLSLIEKDYRDKEIGLPGLSEPFKVPKNVYVVGTMNSLDKSLVTFDFALRRRFPFFKLQPDLASIADAAVDRNRNITDESIRDFIGRADQLNKKIQDFNLPEDYKIGQAYFMSILDFLPESTPSITITQLERERLWDFFLKPLLQEYLGARLDKEEAEELEKVGKEFYQGV